MPYCGSNMCIPTFSLVHRVIFVQLNASLEEVEHAALGLLGPVIPLRDDLPAASV